jgi:hypothetical protein
MRGDLLPQFGDRQIGFFRNKRPYLVLMLGQPPNFRGWQSPVASTRCMSLITQLALTSNIRATSCRDCPERTAHTMRSRKSCE